MVLQELRELAYSLGPILRAHALATRTDTDFNDASADLVRDVDAGLEARGALSVQRFDGCGDGEASGEGGSPEFGCAASWSEDGANGDVFNEVGIDFGAGDEGGEGVVEEVGGGGVFEAAFAAFSDGGAEGAGDDDLRGGLV